MVQQFQQQLAHRVRHQPLMPSYEADGQIDMALTEHSCDTLILAAALAMRKTQVPVF